MSTIPLSGGDDTFESPHDYGTLDVQGGAFGIVFNSDGTVYTTAFVECFPHGTLIRGEGPTIEEADAAAWAKLQAYLSCETHDWEPRGYTNGSGVCSRCGSYGHGVFTAEQLGRRCTVCQAPTLHTATGREQVCREHDPRWVYGRASLAAMRKRRLSDIHMTMYRRLVAVAEEPDVPLDPDALEWAREHLEWEGAAR